MRLRTLVIALAFTVASGLALPGQAEARHRHDRHCRHSVIVDHRGPYWDYGRHGSYGYYGPYRGYRYDGYYGRYGDPYYHPYRYRSYRRGHLHFHGRVRCYLPHLSIHIGW